MIRSCIGEVERSDIESVVGNVVEVWTTSSV